MSSSKRLFGTNGIRGVVNKELTPEIAVKIGSAIGTFFNNGNLIVGHDARISSPMFTKAVVAGLTAAGCNVFFAGMAPTPALQFAVKNCKKDGAVVITASHNPAEYNGIKVVWNDGIELSREQEIVIENLFFHKKQLLVEWNSIGKTYEVNEIIDDYLENICKQVDVSKIAEKQFHIVVDAANSVGGLAAPRLLQDLSCKVTTINAKIDGTFPGRPPEPTSENLGELALTVKALGADLGVAYDGDADRSIFVDERGEIYWGDITFALIEKYFLIENPYEKIVTPVSSSILVKDIADAYGGEIIWTKVGSVTVSQTMKKTGAKLGGEENGGIFYGYHQPVRDGTMATALVLNIMAKTGKKISKLLGELPTHFIVKDRIACQKGKKEKVMEKLVEQVKGLNISIIDGVKIWFKNNSAILIRPSGTEPIYRLYAEAENRERALKLLGTYRSKLKNIISTLEP